MTKEILDLMETRRKSKHNDIEYSRLNKKIKKKCNEAKESFLNNQCKEIESKWNKNSKFVHEKTMRSQLRSRWRWQQKIGQKKKQYTFCEYIMCLLLRML